MRIPKINLIRLLGYVKYQAIVKRRGSIRMMLLYCSIVEKQPGSGYYGIIVAGGDPIVAIMAT